MNLEENDQGIIVSTIIPLYKGQKYVSHLVELCRCAYNKAGILEHAELIFVNDYPDQEIVYPGEEFVHIISNDSNLGIHKSRSNGLINAKGKWVHFLDQDDNIHTDFYLSQLECEKKADVIVANAIVKDCGYDRLLYRNFIERIVVRHGIFYIELDNRIISPGQCLIRRDSVPKVWIDHCMRVNGADDLLLWLLMFDEGHHFELNPKPIYTHEFTGVNLSADTGNMTNSMNELLDFYSKYSANGKFVDALEKKIRFLNGDYNSIDGKMRKFLLSIRKIIIWASKSKHINGDSQNG